MGSLAGEVELFEKTVELSLKRQSLQPAWLREFREAVGAKRLFIWGKGTRQPHINGSEERTSLFPLPSETHGKTQNRLNLLQPEKTLVSIRCDRRAAGHLSRKTREKHKKGAAFPATKNNHLGLYQGTYKFLEIPYGVIRLVGSYCETYRFPQFPYGVIRLVGSYYDPYKVLQFPYGVIRSLRALAHCEPLLARDQYPIGSETQLLQPSDILRASERILERLTLPEQFLLPTPPKPPITLLINRTTTNRMSKLVLVESAVYQVKKRLRT